MRTLALTHVEIASARQRLLTIDLGGTEFEYLPGQAVHIGPHGQQERRVYSIACSPERAQETGTLQFLIALDGREDLAWATSGARVDIDDPIGTFTFPPSIHAAWVLFVAGGTGIAPVRAMLDHLLRRHPAQRVSLLYSTRRSDEFAFLEELREHERRGRIELHQTVTRDDDTSWDGKRGRISRDHFEAVLHEPASTLCFLCGPRSLVLDSAATLRELGVKADAIRTEGWTMATSP